MNYHKYIEMIRGFENMLIAEDSFNKNLLKRVDGQYVVTVIQDRFAVYQNRFVSEQSYKDEPVQISDNSEEVIIPELEIF